MTNAAAATTVAVYGWGLYERTDFPWIHDPRFDEALYCFEPGAIAGRIPCFECDCTGWHAPDRCTSEPCRACKGTGRMWVGL